MLSRRDIEKELGKGINIYPLREDNIKENSINLSISRNAWALGSGSVRKSKDGRFSKCKSENTESTYYIGKGDSAILKDGRKRYLVLLPHVTTLVETSEVIGMSNYIGGTLHSKVGIVAQGIGDIGTMLGPNFCGHLLISLHNVTDEVVAIPVGETFVSVVFHYLDTPHAKTTNPNGSGHVDKFSELGVKIDPKTRQYLTEDWKCKFEGIQSKLTDSDAFKQFRKRMNKKRFSSLWQYLTWRNSLIAAVSLVILVALAYVANILDARTEDAVWVERYWTVVLSGIVIPIVMKVGKLFDKR